MANMIGVVAYSDAQPYLKALFADPNLTLALNETSKKRWVLFASVPQAGQPSGGVVETVTRQLKDMAAKTLSKVFGSLIDMIFKPDIEQSTFLGGSRSDAQAARIRNDLGLGDEDELPCLVLIFPVKADLATGQFEGYVQKYALDPGASKDTAYNGLQKWVKDITVAIEDIKETNLKNAEGVAAAVKLRLTDVKDLELLKKHLPLLPKVAGVLKKVLGLG